MQRLKNKKTKTRESELGAFWEEKSDVRIWSHSWPPVGPTPWNLLLYSLWVGSHEFSDQWCISKQPQDRVDECLEHRRAR